MQLCKFRKEYEGHLRIVPLQADELDKDGSMATLVGAESRDLLKPLEISSGPTVAISRRRHISFEAGHALERLAHAIEYLTDEYVHDGGDFSVHDPRLEAVQLLMALNRQIYFECPEVASLAERCRSWLHLRAA